MVFSSDLSGDELHFQLVGTLVEVVQQALAIPFFVVVLALLGRPSCQTLGRMETTLLEVQRAMAALNVAPESMRLLSPGEAQKVVAITKARFVLDPNAAWWWDSLAEPGSSRLFEEGDGWTRISKFTPNPESPAWFIVEDEDALEFPVFEVSPSLAARVLGECYAFEYYLVAKDYSWLVCENHHNVVIAVGQEAELRLAANAA